MASSSSDLYPRRCGAGVVMEFLTKGVGNARLALIWVASAVGAEGCGVANMGPGRFAKGAATVACETADVRAAQTASYVGPS